MNKQKLINKPNVALVLRDGSVMVHPFVGDYIMEQSGCFELSQYSDDLKHSRDNNYDIIKIYEIPNNYVTIIDDLAGICEFESEDFEECDFDLLWDRDNSASTITEDDVEAVVTRQDIVKQFNEWGVDIFEELEEIKGDKLSAEEIKKMLLYCLGYANSAEVIASVIDLLD